RMEAFDGLDLEHDLAGHHNIQALTAQKLLAVCDRNQLLSFVSDSLRGQLDTDSSGIDAFQQSRPEFAVDSDTAPDRAIDQILEIVREPRRNAQHRTREKLSSCLRVFVVAS